MQVLEGRISTGIGGLDEQLQGGFPPGSLVLLMSSSETSLRTFSQQVAHHMASQGRRVFYIAILREPSYVKEEMTVFGWEVEALIRKGYWNFIDAYTPRINTLLMQKQPLITQDLMVQVRSHLLPNLQDGDAIIIDSLSDLLISQGSETTLELLEILSSLMRTKNGIAFLPLLPDLHDRQTTFMISHQSDTVVEFAVEERSLEGKIIFWKMRRARLQPMFLPLSIKERGIVVETFRRIL